MPQASRGGRRKAVTLDAVAEKAGVSAMTVSNVLNGVGRVGAATRARVREAAEALGYAAGAAPREPALRLGLVFDHPESPFVGTLMIGAVGAASRAGAHLLVRRCAGSGVRPLRAALTALARGGARGVLLPSPFAELAEQEGLIEEMALFGVGVSTGRPLANLATVRIDDEAAALALTEDLLDQGRRRIAFVAGPANHSSSGARRRGYRTGLERRGVAADPALMIEGDWGFASGRTAGRRLLTSAARPDAIFAANDEMAAGVLSAARDLGLRLPADLVVAGFDDSPLARQVTPSLTSVRQPVLRMAEHAVERLAAALRAGQPPAGDTIFAHALVRRRSTAPPRERALVV